MPPRATPKKPASKNPQPAPKRPITWPDVLRVLTADETRSYALNHYRHAGFTPDQFGHLRNARETLSDALTSTEGWLEMQSVDGRRRGERYESERIALREVRRRLELELWP